ncbi:MULTISPECIES: phosphatase PAP2 family protein [unclassified Moraxella]|uniref:phosphatase PAP2 family protein n=1 Tax=unclassified Moraxella TaxID=2685852 RepID=UPI003AF8048B
MMTRNYPTNDLSIRQRIGCLIYFFVVFGLYNLMNAYTAILSQTIEIANLALKLDHHIPFIPSFIILYSCSVWLLIASFFMVADRVGLYHLTQRLLLTTVIACLCFYRLPLTFSFALPSHVQAFDSLGVNWQWAFNLLHSVDKPYNQFPSLHVAYAWVLVVSLWQPNAFFSRYVLEYRWGLSLLGLGIAISTVFTWQHHFLDVIGGSVLAFGVLSVENYLARRLPLGSVKLAVRYIVLVISGYLIIATLPIFVGLSSPYETLCSLMAMYWLISLGVLSGLYVKADSKFTNHFFKKNTLFTGNKGQLKLSAYLWQAPIIISYRLLWWCLAKFQRLTPFNQLKPLTCQNTPYQVDVLATAKLMPNQVLSNQDLTAVLSQYQQVIWLDVASEISASFTLIDNLPNVTYFYFPLMDLQPFDSLPTQQLQDIVAQIDRHLAHVINHAQIDLANTLAKAPSVLIVCQCSMGWSRSVAMMACCLAYFSRLAIAEIRQLLDTHYPYHHVSTDYLSDMVLLNLKQKSTKH